MQFLVQKHYSRRRCHHHVLSLGCTIESFRPPSVANPEKSGCPLYVFADRPSSSTKPQPVSELKAGNRCRVAPIMIDREADLSCCANERQIHAQGRFQTWTQLRAQLLELTHGLNGLNSAVVQMSQDSQ